MEKLLSIAIPSYNMEQYIGRCLDSLIIKDSSLMDALDIIVVNDGSKDRTSEIAHQYAYRYPNSIRVIDKKNGHYGSCINVALESAKGKYFRILDADDWFDTTALVSLLQELHNCDSDIIVTAYCEHAHEKEKKFGFPKHLYGRTISLHTKEESIPNLVMHQLTHRLDLLKRINFSQTTGICYTDTEYVLYPSTQAKDITFFDITLYQYFMGREGQSMAISSLKRNKVHVIKILNRWKNTPILYPNAYKEQFIESFVSILLGNVLLRIKFNKEETSQLLQAVDYVKETYPEVFSDLCRITFHGFPYIRFWYQHPGLYYIISIPIRLYVNNKHYR